MRSGLMKPRVDGVGGAGDHDRRFAGTGGRHDLDAVVKADDSPGLFLGKWAGFDRVEEVGMHPELASENAFVRLLDLSANIPAVQERPNGARRS